MESIKQFVQAGRELWERWTTPQWAIVLAAALLSLLTVIGVGVWSTRPEMVVLASRLPPDQAREAIAQLEAAGITYELSYSGSTIAVPRRDMSRARLAVRETLGESAAGGELEDSIWADPTLQHVRIQRQKEHRLAQSIARFASVREAVVHISAPPPSPFVRTQAPVTASVIITPAPGAAFSGTDADAIVSLVAHSVEGLLPEHVTVMDTNGRLLSSRLDRGGEVSGQLEYVRALESHLASKAEALLSQMLGPGRAMVRVTANVDFTQTERQETTYDPATKVKVSETTKSESHTGLTPGTAGGPAGTASNIAPGSSLSGANAVKIEESTTSYANTEIRDTIKETPGRIRRLTVAAIVDLTERDGQAQPAITTSDVEALIRQAVGFDAQRNDEINVVSAALAGAPELTVPAVPVWEKYGSLVRNVSMAVAGLLMFILGLLVVRRLRPVVVSPAGMQPSEESIRRLAELSVRARQHPELVAKVLETWLDEESASPSSVESGRSSRRAAA